MSIVKWLTNKLKSENALFLFVIFAVLLFVAWKNFPVNGQWLTGWDNLHPEFNFWLNFKRAFSGVWQSNEGLGLVGGHGYAATLPHTIFIWFLSLIFPLNTLRAIFTFLMLLVGSLGAYFLTQHLLSKTKFSNNNNLINSASLFAALLYMLHLGTVQNFYIQLEAFIVHFAFLPWLLLTLWQLLHNWTKKNLIRFVMVNIFILPAAFIPPLFIVQLMLLGISILFWIVSAPAVKKVKTAVSAGLILFCINAFWLLPFIYYTKTHSQNYLNAYNNLQSTEDFIEKNQRFGDMGNVSLARSFLFEANDMSSKGELIPILKPWIQFLKNPLVKPVGYGIFLLSLVGFASLLLKKPRHFEVYSFLGGYFLTFLLLATNTPPFSWINNITRSASPLFEQAFRVAFTKFSIGYVLGMAVCAGTGIGWILTKIKVARLRVGVSLLIFLFLIYYSLPSFYGNLIYKSTKTTIPKDYFDLFAYMRTQPADGRIMNLPQGWNWGWSIYKWGYTGSGFLWYGIEQPVMDRSFDVWSLYNENYYWELVHALYAKDYKQFDSLISKYNISWVLYDPTLSPYPGGRYDFYMQDLEKHFSESSKLVLIKIFGKLKLYKVAGSNQSIVLYKNLPNIAPESFWNNYDQVFLDNGTYISDPGAQANLYYPFRSLFNNRKVPEREFSVLKGSGEYIFTSKIPAAISKNFQTAAHANEDKTVAVKIKPAFRENNTLDLTFIYFYPETSAMTSYPNYTWTIKYPKTGWLSLVMGADEIKLIDDNKKVISETNLFIWKQAENVAYVIAEGNKIVALQKLNVPPELPVTEVAANIQIYVPYNIKGEEYYNSASDPSFFDHKSHNCEEVLSDNQPTKEEAEGKTLVFSSQKDERCFDIVLSSMPQSLGYLVEIVSKNVTGRPLQFALVNKQVEKTDFEMTLPADNSYAISYIVILPMQPDGLGYSLHFGNSSKTNLISENYLKSVRMTPIPYKYLTQLKLEPKKLNDLNYLTNGNKVLVYSQAYDPGWKAYEVASSKQQGVREFLAPIFGREIKEHVKVNNWENGWLLKNPNHQSLITNYTIYLVFWPQYLEYTGFAILGITIAILLYCYIAGERKNKITS